MKRLFNFASAISLLLLLFILLFLIRQHFARDMLAFTVGQKLYFFTDRKEGISLGFCSRWRSPQALQWKSCRPDETQGFLFYPGGLTTTWSRFQIQYLRMDGHKIALNPDETAHWAHYNDTNRLATLKDIHASWYSVDRTSIIIPFRLVLAPLSALPLTWMGLYIRRWLVARRFSRLGLCRICGYDLHATPDRCPECGTAITKAVSPQPQTSPSR